MKALRALLSAALPAALRTLTLLVAVGAPSALATVLAPVIGRLTAGARRLVRGLAPRSPVTSLSRSQLLTSKG